LKNWQIALTKTITRFWCWGNWRNKFSEGSRSLQ